MNNLDIRRDGEESKVIAVKKEVHHAFHLDISTTEEELEKNVCIREKDDGTGWTDYDCLTEIIKNQGGTP